MTCSGLKLSSEFASGNTIYLVNKKDVIVSGDDSYIADKVGYGLAKDYKVLPALKPSIGQSVGRIWDEELGEYKNTDNNSEDFEIQIPTPREQNVTWIESEPEPEPEPETVTDTTPPEIIFSVEPTQSSLNFTINFEITDPLGAVTPSGLAVYNFQWREEGGEWQADETQDIDSAPENYIGIREFLGKNGKTYYFQLSATDIAENNSGWVPEIPIMTTISVPDVKAIVINEIQIEGETVNDDWVELYNPNDFEIDISQWSIQRSPSTGTVYKKNFGADDKIVALGHFLVVRNNASQALLDIADMSCSALQLSSGSSVYLVKNQDDIVGGEDDDIIDKVGIGENAFSFETAPAPVPSAGQSIIRANGVDTDDNSADFVVSETPSPGVDLNEEEE